MLHELARLIDLLVPIPDRVRRLLICDRPIPVLVLVEIPIRHAQRPQSGIRHRLEVALGGSLVLRVVVLAETGVDDGVGSLAVEDDPTVGGTDDDGHALSGGVELENAEGDVALGLTEDLNVEVVVVLVDERETGVSGGGDEGGLYGKEEGEDGVRRLPGYFGRRKD